MTGLVLFPWPVWRWALSRTVRSAAPNQALAAQSVLVGWAVGIVALTAIVPATLFWTVPTATGISALYLVRSRQTYGVRRGLPPGRLTLLPVGPLNDDLAYLRESSRLGPVFKTGSTFPNPRIRPTVCVTDNALARVVLEANQDALRIGPPAAFNRHIPQDFLRYMNVTNHGRYAPIFQASFTPAVVSAAATYTAQRASRCLDEAMDTSGRVRSVSLETELHDLASDVVGRALFGLTPDHALYAGFMTAHRGLAIGARWPRPSRRVVEANLAALRKLIIELAADESMERPSVLRELALVDAELIRDKTVAGNLCYMLGAGSRDVAGLLRWTVHNLVTESGRLLEVAHASDSGPTLDRIVTESLRLEQSEFLLRRVIRPIQVAEHRIPAGWTLRCCVREGHRDPVVWECPHRFDPDRTPSDESSAHYAPFGMHPHRCVGARLTIAVTGAFVKSFADSYVVSDVEPGTRVHARFHWKPGPDFAFTARRRQQ